MYISFIHIHLQKFHSTMLSNERISSYLNGPQRKPKNDANYVASVKKVLRRWSILLRQNSLNVVLIIARLIVTAVYDKYKCPENYIRHFYSKLWFLLPNTVEIKCFNMCFDVCWCCNQHSFITIYHTHAHCSLHFLIHVIRLWYAFIIYSWTHNQILTFLINVFGQSHVYVFFVYWVQNMIVQNCQCFDWIFTDYYSDYTCYACFSFNAHQYIHVHFCRIFYLSTHLTHLTLHSVGPLREKKSTAAT